MLSTYKRRASFTRELYNGFKTGSLALIADAVSTDHRCQEAGDDTDKNSVII